MSNQNSNTSLELVHSDSPVLSLGLRSLQSTLMDAAQQSIEAAITASNGNLSDYTDLNMRAMVITEALRLTSGLDLTTVLTRGAFIKQIEDEGLYAVHPNGYANLTALAKDAGIASVSELSNIRDLCEVIFPYLQNVLQLDLNDVWEKVGKSNFRELVPALRSMITGEDADHESVRTAVNQMLDNSAADMMANGEATVDTIDEEQVRRSAVENLLRQSTNRTVRQVRDQVRPSRTPRVPMATIRQDEQWYAVLRITSQDQYDMIQRILNSHTNNQIVENALTPAVRRFLNSLLGDNG